MTESFLHYLWQFQYFDKKELYTTQGELIQIFNTGNLNSHAGPDFFNARIKIGDMDWIGSVEVHIHASGWLEHKHNFDPVYENVILHVVWSDDKPIKRSDHSTLPTLELKARVDANLILKYNQLVESPSPIPCALSFKAVSDLTKFSMLDRVLMQRLETKSIIVTKTLERNGNDWEETCYQLLAKNFGFKVNAEPFLQLAQSLPYKILLKHADKLLQIEALIFGQAGFLEDSNEDEYFKLLKREYSVLKVKYSLTEKKLKKEQWKFLRLRPANFPTIRLAQFASLIHRQKNIFSKIIYSPSTKEIKQIFKVVQSQYWLQHYQFEKGASDDIAPLGSTSIENIIINTVVPLLTAYGKEKDDQSFIDKAVDILQNTLGENNVITRQWKELGFESKNSFDSQALIELYNNFCIKRKCLDCNIGASLVRPLSV